MEDKIRRFLEETFLFEFGGEITPETDLFREAIIDSSGYVRLIAFLESEFGFTYSDDEMLSSMTVNLSGMIASVAEKTAALKSRV